MAEYFEQTTTTKGGFGGLGYLLRPTPAKRGREGCILSAEKFDLSVPVRIYQEVTVSICSNENVG
jgi:hypothetical protein